MSDVYKETELIVAAQIAYMDCSNCENYTLQEILDHKQRWFDAWQQAGVELPAREQSQLDAIKNIRDVIEKNGNTQCYNWKIIDVCDKNNDTGFYGCVLSDDQGNAVVSFRGSEAYDLGQWGSDWAGADFGLLNSKLTKQQKDAEDYVKYLDRKYGDQIKTYSFSGHSLGGNLSEHAIVTAPDEIWDKVDQAISFDGPGFSEKYIKEHQQGIERAEGHTKHYSWSIVSCLLTELPGIPKQLIKALNPTGDDSNISGLIEKHSMINVEYDPETGKLLEGNKDWFMEKIESISNFIANPEFDNTCMSILFKGGISALVFFVDGIRGGAEAALKTIQRYQDIMADIKVKGEYEVESTSLRQTASMLENIDRQMDSISNQMQEIKNSLRYYSLAGTYFKSCINLYANQVKRSKNAASLCSEAVMSAADLYDKTDQAVAGYIRGK